MRFRRAASLVALSLCVVGGCSGGNDDSNSIVVTDVDDVGEFDFEFVIPPGTGDQIAAGNELEIVPRELVVEVGDSLRIVNNDDQGHAVGVFYVGAGETLTQRFDSAGVLEGLCDIHPSGSFTLRVEA